MEHVFLRGGGEAHFGGATRLLGFHASLDASQVTAFAELEPQPGEGIVALLPAFHLLVTLSIAMGLGVDYGIYMVSRLREEMQATGGKWLESLQNTMNTTGSAVIISVVVLLGSFIPLVGTNLANTWGLAIYIGEALLIDVFTALMLLPMLVWVLKPKYVFDTSK